MNYKLIAAALYTLGPDLCARCFAYLDEAHLDGIISEPGSRPHRSMAERIRIIAALGDSPEPPGIEEWEALVTDVFARAYADPEALTGRLTNPDFHAASAGRLDKLSPGELVRFDNPIERLAMGESARSEIVRVREWLGFLAETADLAGVRNLVSPEGHALELIYRPGGVDEIQIRDAVLDEDLGLPDYPPGPPPWVREIARSEAGKEARDTPGAIRYTTTAP